MKKLVLFTLFLAACSQEGSDASIAEVNGEAITKPEIEKLLASFTGLKTAKLEDYPADFQKEFLNKYIEKKLLLEAARDSGYQNDEEIKAKLKDAEDFLLEQKLLTDLVKEQKTEAKLKEIYDEAVKDREGQDEAKASHILLETEAEAKDIKKKLDGGADFAKLAGQFSKDPGSKINGGQLGYFTADKMVPEFSKAAFAMKKGQISAPVKSNFGWHVIKLEDKRPLVIPTMEQAKPALEKELARRAVETAAEFDDATGLPVDSQKILQSATRKSTR
jgi:peptidyl-prolyl cis-trans isomerase C